MVNIGDALVISCYFDPREQFYTAGFDDTNTHWSYDLNSTVKALENFVIGIGTYTPVVIPVAELLERNPFVTIKFDTKSLENLTHECRIQKLTPESLLSNLLKVDSVEIQSI